MFKLTDHAVCTKGLMHKQAVEVRHQNDDYCNRMSGYLKKESEEVKPSERAVLQALFRKTKRRQLSMRFKIRIKTKN